MASKRVATSELTHENWDVDDAPEEAGTFQKASENVLKSRVIKRAVRRNPISSVRNTENDSEKSNIFGNFSFKKASPANYFDFLNNIKKPEETKTNGLNNLAPFTNIHKENHSNFDKEKNKDYYAKLKGLNESVSEWIKKHVDENPLINLSPIFNDYEKYLKEIEDSVNSQKTSVKIDHTLVFEKSTSTIEQNEGTNTFSTPTKLTTTTTVKTSVEQVETTKNSNESTSKFSFGMPFAKTTPNVNFNFGSNSKLPGNTSLSENTSLSGSTTLIGTKTATGFTFGGATSTPCTFKNVAAPSSTNKEDTGNNNNVEDEDDQPPKVEFKEVEEEDYTFKMRCKVFVKKNNAFTDKGVGNLFLKPIPDKDKVQLIVRADTNLGNLLCNFILSESIPIQKKGAKDVLLVCLPMPDFTSPVPLLLRVKTPKDAETLFQELEKNKR